MSIIGLTCGLDYAANNFYLRASYQQVLAGYGAGVCLLPPQRAAYAPRLLASLDGLIFTGGGDLSPHLWQAEPQRGTEAIDPKRDEWELALWAAALTAGLPVLAICRGMQLGNVALGGSILQDLAQEKKPYLAHRQQAPGWYASHKVKIIHPWLQTIVGDEEIAVNSFHHQGIDRLGKNLLPAAVSSDGLREAWILPQHPFCLGVQWHPELSAPQDTASGGIFAAFMQAAEKRQG